MTDIDHINTRILESGLRVTGPRLKILQALAAHPERHLTAEAIHQTLQADGQSIGLATVYRALAQFAAAGLVVQHHFDGDQAIYELDRGEHHDHLVCTECGCVQEFVDEVVEARQIAIAKTHQFRMTDHQFNIYGVCRGCQLAEAKSPGN